MAADFTYDGTKIVTANGNVGAPKRLADMYNTDLALTFELLAAWNPNNNVKALTNQVQPADSMGLKIIFVVAAKTAEADFIFVTGTDIDGNAQTDSLDVTPGNDVYITAKWFATITNIDCSDNAAGGGAVWDDGTVQVIQDRWGVVWEIVENGLYRVDCDIDFGNGVDATYFQMLNEMLYLADGKVFRIEDNATFEMGDASGDWSFKGSVISLRLMAGYDSIAAGDTTAVFKTYGSMIIRRDTANFYQSFYAGTWIARNLTYSGVGGFGYLRPTTGFRLDWKNVRIFNIGLFRTYVTPTNFEDVHIHNCGTAMSAGDTVTIPDLNVTDAATWEIQVVNVANKYMYLTNPKFVPDVAKMQIAHATGFVQPQFPCDIHVTDKDGADLDAVDVDCAYAHLVEGSDAKTYKCIQDHTAVDATHKPVTGTNWTDYWVLYNAAGGLGGDWTTGFDYKASEGLFVGIVTGGTGDIPQQLIQYKKWLSATEVLEARIHTFTFSHADYPDFVMSDIIVDHPLVWEFDMGQSTSDIETIVAGELATYDPPTRAEATADKDAVIAEVDANEAKVDTALAALAIITGADGALVATDALDAAALKADAVTELQNGLATEAKQDAAQLDLDKIPAAPAPASEYDVEMARITADVATAAKQDTAQSDLDKLTGADGATLATDQGNYAPAKAGNEMALIDGGITSAKYDESTAFPVSQKASLAASTIVIGAVVADGGNSTTQFKTNVVEVTNDHYLGRVVLFVTGNLAGQATDVTDYDGVNKIFVVTAMTEIPASADVFVLV